MKSRYVSRFFIFFCKFNVVFWSALIGDLVWLTLFVYLFIKYDIISNLWLLAEKFCVKN